MVQYSDNLRLSLQETNENPNSWGQVLNQGVFELVEDAIAGLVSVSLDAGNVTLTANQGAADQARAAILVLTGTSLASAREVIVPSLSKVYLVRNDTTGGQTITVKTAAGAGVTIPAGAAVYVYCDGTDVLAPATTDASNADFATLAGNSNQLGGIAAANFARLDLGSTNQQFLASQSTQRQALVAGASVAVNADNSNSFYLQPNQNFTLQNPSGAPNGTTIRIAIEQPAGANYAITWGTAYYFAGGIKPVLTATNGAIDYFSFEKLDTNVWIGGGLLDLQN